MNQFLVLNKDIFTTYELEFSNLVEKQNMKKNIDDAIRAVLIQKLQEIKTYDEFKQLIFGAVGYTRKKTINNDNALVTIFGKIESIVKLIENKNQRNLIENHIKFLKEDILKQWESLFFGSKDDLSKVSGPLAEELGAILDQNI